METTYTKLADGSLGRKVSQKQNKVIPIGTLQSRLDVLLIQKQRMQEAIDMIQEDITGFENAEIVSEL